MDIFEAAASGNIAVFKAYARNGTLAQALHAQNPNGQTPLMVAAMNGQYELVEALLGLAAPQDLGLEAQDNDGNTALHLAAKWQPHVSMHDQANVINMLMVVRHSTGLEDMPINNDENEPLHVAVLTSNHAAATALSGFHHKNRADVDALGQAGNTPLIMAILCGDVPMMRILLENGATLKTNENGACPEAIAARSGHVASMECLISEFQKRGQPLDMNAEYCAGKSFGFKTSSLLLIEAMCHYDASMVELLLKHNAKTNVKDTVGYTPLAYAKVLQRNLGFPPKSPAIHTIVEMLEQAEQRRLADEQKVPDMPLPKPSLSDPEGAAKQAVERLKEIGQLSTAIIPRRGEAAQRLPYKNTDDVVILKA